MLDTRRLRMLKEFAERGTIAATAAALGYTASAVSQQLAVLEREAGAPLLDRSARAAELTDAGRRLAASAEQILAMIEAAEADLAEAESEPSGRVVVAAFPTAAIAFAPALARCVRAHPGLRLLLRQSPQREGPRQVRTGEVDVALVDDWAGRLSGDESAGLESAGLESAGLRFRPLLRDPLVLVVPRGHRCADPAVPVDVSGLLEEPWLAAPAGEPSRRVVDRLLATAAGAARPAGAAGAGRAGKPAEAPLAPWEFEGLGTILSLVARGIGIAALPRLALAAGERRVVVRELPGEVPARDVYAAVRASSIRRPSVVAILAALTAAAERLRGRMPPGQRAGSCSTRPSGGGRRARGSLWGRFPGLSAGNRPHNSYGSPPGTESAPATRSRPA